MKLEVNQACLVEVDPVPGVLVTPAIGPDYWLLRVPLTATQALVAFPKFGTIGIGFQVEGADWNTNLPAACPADEIYRHIRVNKGDPAIQDDDCIAAIKLLQRAAKQIQDTAEKRK